MKIVSVASLSDFVVMTSALGAAARDPPCVLPVVLMIVDRSPTRSDAQSVTDGVRTRDVLTMCYLVDYCG